MTESESLHPRRRLAAFAFTLLVALSIASTLAWNMNSRSDRPAVREASVQEVKTMIDAGAIAIDVRTKAAAASTGPTEAQPDSQLPKATEAAR